MKSALNWPSAPANGQISPDEVHVWAISVASFSGAVVDLLSLLSAEERERASRFHFEKDRLRFIIARGLLRTILGNYLGMDPTVVRFCYGQNGKPELAQPCPLRFNLSHADDLVLLGISKDRAVGVDVEKIDDFRDVEDVANRFFLPEEIAELNGFAGSRRLQEFYRCWTRGEALLKWSGEGIVEPEDRREIAKRFNGSFYELAPASGYVAAVAVAGGSCSISKRQWCALPSVLRWPVRSFA